MKFINSWNLPALEARSKGMTNREITDLLNTSYGATFNAVRSFIKRMETKYGEITPEVLETIKSSGSCSPAKPATSEAAETKPEERTVEFKNGETTFSGIIALMDGEPITPETIMKAHNLSAKEWDVVTYKTNFWQAQQKGGGRILLYQSKITVKPKKHPELTFDEIKAHFDEFKSSYKPVIRRKNVHKDADTMLEINIADLHFGKLAWAPEASEHYDYKIARRKFNSIIDQEIEKAKYSNIEKILFVWSNDFFNSDGISDATTGGTKQDNDVRWQKMFLLGVEMLVDAITKLSYIAPVETFLIASNHSHQVEFYAINYLSAWFREDPRVTVNINCRTRYYYQYGVNLIGFSHSYYETKKNLQKLMPVEAAEAWSKTKYREFHLAHYHCELTEESGGVIYRYLPSVTGPDAWHESSGFLGAVQRSYSFLWDKNRGLKAILVDYPE